MDCSSILRVLRCDCDDASVGALMNEPKFLPSEACAYALAMLEDTQSRHPPEFIYREACGVLESAGINVSVEKPYDDATEYQAEVCSPVEYESGRQAFAMVGMHETERGALIQALQNVFTRD